MAARAVVPGAATADGTKVAIRALAGYSMSESAIPARVGDSTGGTAQISVTGVAGERYRYANEQELTLTTEDGAEVTGVVSSTSYDYASDNVEYVADTLLNKLNIEIQALPYWGVSAAKVFEYMMGIGGIENTSYDSDLDDEYSCFMPGFVGNLWDNVKQWCAAFGLEVYADGDTAYLTRKGRFELQILDVPANAHETIDTSDHAPSLNITNYNYKGVYHKPLWKADTVYSVGAGESQEIRVSMEGTPSFVDQPQVVSSMFGGNENASRYVVTGSDGYIVSTDFWTDNYGSIEVAISPDAADELIITIHGANVASRAPYRISEGAADRPALWISGHGLLRKPTVTNFVTGDTSVVGEPVEIDNPYIGNATMMYDASVAIAAHYSGPEHKLSMSGVPNMQITRKAFTRWSPVMVAASVPRLTNRQASLGQDDGVAHGWALGLSGNRPEVTDTGIKVVGTPSASGVCMLRSMELSNTAMENYPAWSAVFDENQWLIVPQGSGDYTAKVTLTRNSGTAALALKMRVLSIAPGPDMGTVINYLPRGAILEENTAYTGSTGSFTNGVSTSITVSGNMPNGRWIVLELVSTSTAACDFTVTAVQVVKGTSTTTVPPVVTPESVVGHSYGRVSGAMVRYEGDCYRVLSAGYSPDGVTLELVGAASIADFNEAWDGKTIANFNTGFPTLTSGQHGVVPLELAE